MIRGQQLIEKESFHSSITVVTYMTIFLSKLVDTKVLMSDE